MFVPVVSHQVIVAVRLCRAAWLRAEKNLAAWSHVHTFMPDKIFRIHEGAKAINIFALVALVRWIVGPKMFSGNLSASWPLSYTLPDIPESRFVPVLIIAL